MGGRIVLLVTSPRLPAGLLTAQAWDCLRAARVCTGADNDQVTAVRAAGIDVAVVEPTVAVLLAEIAEHCTVVWLADPAHDGALARELGLRLVREPSLAELELMFGSWDPSGARLLDVVAVLDQLVAPGGDPWLSRHVTPDATGAPSHRGLAHYLLEEAYEAYDAMRADDLTALREELGDVLLQVVLHARIGAAAGADGFTIDDVAGDLVEKLIRRNPHVFGGAEVTDLDEITRNWEQIKQAEKARTSAMEGIALSQPALALAAEVLSRSERAQRATPDRAGAEEAGVDRDGAAPAGRALTGAAPAGGGPELTEAVLGQQLFALVERARAAGLNAEAALRHAVLDRMDAIRSAEADRRADD